MKLQTLNDLRLEQTIEIKTRLSVNSVFIGHIFRAKVLKDFSLNTERLNLNLYLEDKELIFYRVVKRWQDVYSYTKKNVALHPSTFALLRDNNVRMICTFSQNHQSLNLASLPDFNFIDDLGIGHLRRARVENTTFFKEQIQFDVKTLRQIMSLTSPPVVDELLKTQAKSKQTFNDKQGSLF